MKVKILFKEGFKVIDINRRKAIREKCRNCSNWNKAEVEQCQITDCHLYPYRMGKGRQNVKERDRAIRKYCLNCMNGNKREVVLCPAVDCPLFAYRNVGLDRSIEINSGSCRGHIGAVSEAVLYCKGFRQCPK